MFEKLFSLLGIARRAGRLSLGHDAVIQSIVKNEAKLCLCSNEASARLRREIGHACSFEGKRIPFIVVDCGSEALSRAVGQKITVLSVNDDGFAEAMKKQLEGKNKSL